MVLQCPVDVSVLCAVTEVDVCGGKSVGINSVW
jgi:hypothetical protein